LSAPTKGGHGERASWVYKTLIEKIRTRQLAPGTRVREEMIATMLDVSRTPVREALARLQAGGLVEATAAGLAVVQLDRSQTMELYALRAILEGAAARFAAENASSSDLVSLDYVLNRFMAFDGDAAGFAQLNRLFHEAVLEAAHNRFLLHATDRLYDSLALLPDTTFSQPGRAAAAKHEHAAILQAIKTRDKDTAEKAARKHINEARNARIALLFDVR
jgi:DNA-binding GntR family transcriptional regulator